MSLHHFKHFQLTYNTWTNHNHILITMCKIFIIIIITYSSETYGTLFYSINYQQKALD